MSVQKFVLVGETAYIRLPSQIVLESGLSDAISTKSRMTADQVFIHEEEWSKEVQPRLRRSGLQIHLAHAPLHYGQANFEESTAPYSADWVKNPRIAVGDEVAGAKIVEIIDSDDPEADLAAIAKKGRLAALENAGGIEYVHLAALPAYEHAWRQQPQNGLSVGI